MKRKNEDFTKRNLDNAKIKRETSQKSIGLKKHLQMSISWVRRNYIIMHIWPMCLLGKCSLKCKIIHDRKYFHYLRI